MTLFKSQNRRLLVLATTRQLGVMKELGLEDAFNVILNVPSVEKAEHVKQVFHDLNISIDEKELDKIASDCPFPIGIRQACFGVVTHLFIRVFCSC